MAYTYNGTTYTYSGTAITGTKKSGKTFPYTNINRAWVDQTYFNTKTGHVYKCVSEGSDKYKDGKQTDHKGSPTQAKWEYVRTIVISAPTAKVTSLTAPSRKSGTRTMEVSWKVPKTATSSTSGSRASKVEVQWVLAITGEKGKSCQRTYTVGTDTTKASANLSGFRHDGGKTWTRKSFYPLNTTRRLTAVSCRVRLVNSKGKGPWATVKSAISKPKAPTVSAFAQDADTGDVKCTIKTDAGAGLAERYHTWCMVVLYDSYSKRASVHYHTPTATNQTITLTDVKNRMRLTYSDHVRCTIVAVAQGWAGDSKDVTRDLYVSYPHAPKLEKVKYTTSPAYKAGGKMTLPFKLGATTEHPVTGVRMQALRDVAYTDASKIPANADWEDVEGTEDDGTCTALAANVEHLVPVAGKRTWVRVKVWNQMENTFYRYSAPKRLTSLETKGASGKTIYTTQPVATKDNLGLYFTLGWDPNDGCTGTQVAWSDRSWAWSSDEVPEPHEFVGGGTNWRTEKRSKKYSGSNAKYKGKYYYPETIKVAKKDSKGNVVYKNQGVWGTRKVYISGNIEEGKTYHIRARRFREEADGSRTYSSWSTTVKGALSTKPSSVALQAPTLVATGADIDLSWEVGGDYKQTAWNAQVYDFSKKNWAIVDKGEGTLCSTKLTQKMYKSRLNGCTCRVKVQSTTGGSYVNSNTKDVTVAVAPTLSLSVPKTVTAQSKDAAEGPVATVTCDTTDVNLAVTIRAVGTDGEGPAGRVTQAAGDTVWTWSGTRDKWTASGGKWKATVAPPVGLALVDGARYEVEAKATSTKSGLDSAAATKTFAVNWAHHAPAPHPDIEVVPYDETDGDGMRERGCRVKLWRPAGSVSTDVTDVYRVTPDGASLVAEGVAMDALVVDPYAPYGTGVPLAYRVAMRTRDGDVAWADYDYALPGGDLRVDFDDGRSYVELPYNLALGDSFSKDFESRRHLDGSIEGYWDAGVERKATLSTDVIRVTEPEKAAAIRALARWSSACLVRTPDGCCYAANVDVGGMDTSATSAALAVSLDATEIRLPEEYRAHTEPWVQAEETDEDEEG